MWQVTQILREGSSRRIRGLPTPRSLAWDALSVNTRLMVQPSSCPAVVGLGLGEELPLNSKMGQDIVQEPQVRCAVWSRRGTRPSTLASGFLLEIPLWALLT